MTKRVVKHLGYKCLGPTITPKKIKALQSKLAHDEHLNKLKEHFAVLSGRTRLDILILLSYEKELCVCDMADILANSVSAISHQLKVLKEVGLVENRRDSKTIFYAINKKGAMSIQAQL